MNTQPNVLQISCVQLHWAKDIEENVAKHRDYLTWARSEGSDIVLFPEASLTGYDFDYILATPEKAVVEALNEVARYAADLSLYAIVGSLQRRGARRFLNLAHVISPRGKVVYEYAKVQLAGRLERKYCRPGDKIALFKVSGCPCTLIICRDGRHPELYRLPAMAGARILFHPASGSERIEGVAWKSLAGRATHPAGPTTHIFHCVANTVGQSRDGLQTSAGGSFIKDPTGLSLAEAGACHEEMITARLNLERATRCFAWASMMHPRFLRPLWKQMLAAVRTRAKDPSPL
ncbi:MAG: carbon-nitrogen hydrolase family protein [Candidatus Sumerlaeia bacterium]|nr:carbon-nitrogen hydrolase family protein [Candidatus Sumerlaeia bacterium]